MCHQLPCGFYLLSPGENLFMFLLAAYIFFLGKRLNALPVNRILKNPFAYLCGSERKGVCTCITAHMWRSEDNLREFWGFHSDHQACWQMSLHSIASCKPSLLMVSTFLKIFLLLVLLLVIYTYTHVMKHLSMISINL